MATVYMDSKGHQSIRHLGTEDRYYRNANKGIKKDIRLLGFDQFQNI